MRGTPWTVKVTCERLTVKYMDEELDPKKTGRPTRHVFQSDPRTGS